MDKTTEWSDRRGGRPQDMSYREWCARMAAGEIVNGWHEHGSRGPHPVQSWCSHAKHVDTRRLYAWLGEQIRSELAELNESAISLDESAGPQYHAEALASVREHMRRIEVSLPYDAEIDGSW